MCVIKLQEGDIKFSIFQNYLIIELFKSVITWIRNLRRCFPIGSMLLLLLLSRFSRVRLCAAPWTAALQAPPSLGFSRQEHWSGLPFPFIKIIFGRENGYCARNLKNRHRNTLNQYETQPSTHSSIHLSIYPSANQETHLKKNPKPFILYWSIAD